MFELVVDLYRKIGRPAISGEGAFSYSGTANSDLQELVERISTLDSRYGDLYLRKSDNTIKLELSPNSSGEFSFFETFEDLVRKTPSLGAGQLLNSFYIINDDWTPSDNTKHPSHEQLNRLCRLTKNLSKVAASQHEESSFFNLVFTVPGSISSAGKTVVLQTKINPGILKCNLSKASLIASLASRDLEGRIHLEERKAIFSGAVCEILDSGPEEPSEKFMFLLERWGELMDIYWKNFQIYIHAFSFEKVRKEFAQAELDYGTKLSSAFSDIGGKLLALPISFVAFVTLSKATDNIEIFSTLAGLFITTLILIAVLINQLLNIQRLNSSLSISFENISKKIETYPKNLQKLIRKAKTNVNHQKTVVKCTMGLFMFLATIPAIVGCVIVYTKYEIQINYWLAQLQNR